MGHQLTGVDLSQIDGIGPYNALRLLSEIGTDMTRWPTEKHFTSWLTLAPHKAEHAASVRALAFRLDAGILVEVFGWESAAQTGNRTDPLVRSSLGVV